MNELRNEEAWRYLNGLNLGQMKVLFNNIVPSS